MPMVKLSWAEIAKHNTADDLWVVIDGKVYDMSRGDFLDEEHPGGVKMPLRYGGKDATEQWNAIHGHKKEEIMATIGATLLVGVVDESSASSSATDAAPTGFVAKVVALSSGVAAAPARTLIDPRTESSTCQSWHSGGTAGVLPAERARASFETEAMTHIYDGGKKETDRRRFIASYHEGADLQDKYNISDRASLIGQGIGYFMEIHEGWLQKALTGEYEVKASDFSKMTQSSMYTTALGPHFGLFLPALMGNASGEQLMWWLPKAITLQMVGSYAQTELGHGSNVRGLQTTATYDRETQHFVLDTPTLQSMKWWPSNLGKTATHCTIYAQLVIDDVEYGVHVFFLQVRDEHHLPLPGIEVGEVGVKLGDLANDTGYMRLRNVRIPRQHMLAKRQHVTPEGVYVKHGKKGKKKDKGHYAAVMGARGALVGASASALAQGAVITTRYSAVRSQGFMNTSTAASFRSTPERHVIDYTAQTFRTLRQTSSVYAFRFVSRWMTELMGKVDGAADDSILAEAHAASAGLKALCTTQAVEGLEDLRKCCGGHGYLASAGVGWREADFKWLCTADGDWIVLLLQTARFLIKSLAAAREGKPLSGLCACLEPLSNASWRPVPREARSVEDFLDLDWLIERFELRSLTQIVSAGDKLASLMREGKTYDEAWNATALRLVAASKSHCHLFILAKFAAEVVRVEASGDVATRACAPVLRRLCALYAVANMSSGEGWHGLLSTAEGELLSDAIERLCLELRPDAVALVDAFDIPDRVLNSVLGCYDGNVYERLYKMALRAPLNQKEVFEQHYCEFERYLDKDFLAMHNQCIGAPSSSL